MISASPRAAQSAFIRDISSVYGTKNGDVIETEGSHTPDYAAEIDKEEDILADLLGITPKQALRVLAWHSEEKKKLAGEHREAFGRVIGFLLRCDNLRVMLPALACSWGLDQVGEKKSQAQFARELGVTRSLFSHYVLAFTDLCNGVVTKFRKAPKTRKIFKELATDPFTSAKKQAINRLKNTCN
jgi:hypothetical protein